MEKCDFLIFFTVAYAAAAAEAAFDACLGSFAGVINMLELRCHLGWLGNVSRVVTTLRHLMARS